MKKTLLLLASAALLLVGCAKEQIAEKNVGGEGLQTVSFTVGVESAATKAVADEDGKAANINHWIMQVLDSDGDVYNYQEKDGEVGVKTQTFTVPLVKGQTYQVLFWADTKGNYVVSDLRDVKRAEAVSLTANRDDLDAFSAVEPNFSTTQATSKEITLKRPFAQLNVVFTDLKKLYDTMGSDAEFAKFKPTTFVAKAKVPTTFDVLHQTAGSPSATVLAMNAAECYNPSGVEGQDNYTTHTEKATLYMDYILATAGSKDIVDIDFSFVSKGVTIAHNFASIPFQRNYRTNIIGELMSAGATWNVVVDPEWTGENDWTYVTEGSVAAAIEALAAGKTAIEITAPADYTTPVAIPAEADGKDISIKVTGVTGKDMTFNLAAGAQGPANLYITTDAQNLVITLPNSHVEVNGGTYQTVEATTSANTLLVGKEVTIETLKILAGNVEIYGKVTGLNRANGVKADWYVDSREKLIAGLTKSIAGEAVVLTSDIDLNNEEWAPVTIGKAITFDGDNHTIKNLKIAESYSDSHYGLIGYLYSNGVIKNLTIDGAQILLPESKGDSSRGAALVGIARDGDIINCHVKNVTVKAYQKVGGLIGQYSLEASGTSVVKDCSAESVIISENITGEGVWGAGGLIGSLCFNNNGHSINVEGCSVKGISIANSTTEAAPKQTAHAFIGTIREDAEATATLTGNTVEQTAGLYTDMYTSDYFGWATNPESDPSHKCSIIIDGTPWTPNYPVKIAGGKGYATLNEALTAATAGQTVQILKAGDYTVQTLSTKAAVVEATVEGVVFNHTAAATSWVASCSGTTVKNVTWNVGNAHHQYFSNTNLENCTVNGLLCTHQTEKFKDCTFVNEAGYNFWVYGNEYTEFDNCTFTCPGKNDGVAGCGSAINCYNEGDQHRASVLVVKNCTFTAKEASDKYSAIYVKPETAFDIRISNSTCNDKFFTGAISGSKLWNLKSDREGTTVSIDGNMVYPFSMDANGNYGVKNVNGLKMAIKHWNALKAAGEKSITLADGTYNVSDMAIFQNYADKSLLIKAENEKQAVITPNAGSKQLIFVVAGMSKSYAGHITIDGIKFDMSNASNKNIESDVISISDAVGTNLPADEKALYSGTYHYGHDITIKNCEIIGFGDIENSAPENGSEHCSVARADGKNGNGYNVKVQNCIIDKMGYVLTSKITTLAEVSNCTITNTKCVINNTSDGTEYKVINNSISTYYDYCIRVNFGPLTVSGNTFNCTYSGDATDAGAVVLRGSTGNKATITGNTFTKASGTMNDVYCVTSWEVDNGVVTKTIPAGKGIMDISKLGEPEL